MSDQPAEGVGNSLTLEVQHHLGQLTFQNILLNSELNQARNLNMQLQEELARYRQNEADPESAK